IAETKIIPALDKYLKKHPANLPRYPGSRLTRKDRSRATMGMEMMMGMGERRGKRELDSLPKPSSRLNTKSKTEPYDQVDPERLKAIYQNVTIEEHLTRLKRELDVDTIVNSLRAVSIIIEPGDTYLVEQMMIPARRLGGWVSTDNGTPSQDFMANSQLIYQQIPRPLRLHAAVNELRKGTPKSHAVALWFLISDFAVNRTADGIQASDKLLFNALDDALAGYQDVPIITPIEQWRGRQASWDVSTESRNAKTIHERLFDFIAIQPQLVDECENLFVKLDPNATDTSSFAYRQSIEKIQEVEEELLREPWIATVRSETIPLVKKWPTQVNPGFLAAYDWELKSNSDASNTPDPFALLRWETHYVNFGFNRSTIVPITNPWTELNQQDQVVAADYWCLAMLWSMTISPEKSHDQGRPFTAIVGPILGNQSASQRIRSILRHHKDWIEHLEGIRNATHLPRIADLAVAYLRQAVDSQIIRSSLVADDSSSPNTVYGGVGGGGMGFGMDPQATKEDNAATEQVVIPALDKYLQAHPMTLPEYPASTANRKEGGMF
ncbi:MAG: hypothetical protein AAF664_23970, partial [Planctomycetota bacterium]